MSKITNASLTRCVTGCFIAVPVWQLGRQTVKFNLLVSFFSAESCYLNIRIKFTDDSLCSVWLRGSSVVSVGDVLQEDLSRFEVDSARGTLTINDVRLDDEDNYVCVVNTTAQPVVTSTNAHLYVESQFHYSVCYDC